MSAEGEALLQVLGAQTASLAACLGHIRNETGQTPDVLTEC